MERLKVYISWRGDEPTVPMKLIFENVDMGGIRRELLQIKNKYRETSYRQKTFTVRTLG